MTTLWRDIRFAVRTFGRNRGFTLAVTVSIALGIAANTTVFTMVDALLFGDMPVREPERLVVFGGGRTFSSPDFVDYRDQGKSVFQGVSAHFPLVPASIGGTGEPERVWGQLADAAYFSMVGVPMQAGRGFLPAEDDGANKSFTVVLSDALWRRRFAADPGIVGRDIVLNNSRYRVVGVTARGFHGLDRGFLSEFWAPLSMAAEIMPDLQPELMAKQRTSQWLILIARLQPGVTWEGAAAVTHTVQRRLEAEYRKGEKPREAITFGKVGALAGEIKGVGGLAAGMMVVVGLVLLIACVNVASLLLARATVRQKEIAIRLSIGAGRWALVRQLLTESMLLSLAGTALGLVLAAGATQAIAGFRVPLPVPIGLDFKIDYRVLAFTAALGVVTGIVFGLAPALRATRPRLAGALKNEAAALEGTRRLGARGTLVLVQVAGSLVLLVGAGLFVRSMQNAATIDLGMRTDGVVMMAFDPKLHHYTPEKTKQFVAQVRERVSALPGVQSVSFVDSLPLSIGGTEFGFKRVGGDGQAKDIGASVYMVGSGYFRTLGIPMLRGRDFDGRRDGAAALVVNEEMARRLFAGKDPLGGLAEADGGPVYGKRQFEVIGVVRNTKSRTLGEEVTPCAYLFLEPKPEAAFSFYGITVLVRAAGAPGRVAAAVREQIRTLDANLPVYNQETMQEHVNKSMLLPRLAATLLGLFGAVGIVLATIGLYGVVSYAARARTREIGIRMALGAQPAAVLKMILRQGLTLVGVGLAIGMAAAFALARFAASLLYGIGATDPMTFTVVPVAMLAVAVAAVLIPARRAARVDPLAALHQE